MLCGKPQTVVNEVAVSIEPWKQRVLTEKDELNDKIGKLAAFLSSEQFAALPEAEQDRLTRQLDAMTAYRSILTERINAWHSPSPTDPVSDAGSNDAAATDAADVGTVPESPSTV